MTISVLNRYIKKKAPITVNYRNYNKFNETNFRNDLIWQLNTLDNDNINYDNFKRIFLNVLQEHAPSKRKVIRGNSGPFMNKTLSKAFTHRSKLKK